MLYSLATRPARSFARTPFPAVSDRALERFLGDTIASLTGPSVAPDGGSARAASVEDLEKTYQLQLDVPGLAKDQLDISVEGDVVRVVSKPEASRKLKAAWKFPLEIDADNCTAALEHGVLTLSLGKKLPVSQVRQVTIS